MKILYAGALSFGTATRWRQWALERLGHHIIPFDSDPYVAQNDLLRKIEFRLVAGPATDRLNADLVSLAEREKPDVFWSDKVLKVKPATLDRMRALGLITVSYMIDNAFGPRKDPGWRLYTKTIPHYDLHVTQRDVSITDYRQRGARDVMKVQTAYEPVIHFPPPAGWSDKDRAREVSFIGNPYDDRAQILSQLGEAGIPLTISGNRAAWSHALAKPMMDRLFVHGELFEQAYRETIWKSKINLSFVTRSNLDEFTQKSFEIAGCGGFLLAERSAGHSAKFVEDEEAVFFTGVAELKQKINRYLSDEAARTRIAAAGMARAHREGYHNDAQVALILARAQSIADARRKAA